MTTYYGPAATGSGVAEVIGYLNGVNLPGFLQFNTLITKIIGVSLAVAGKLCVGKEGPLAHIGAVIGVSVLYIPWLGLEHLQNDENKRLFVAAGASCGVSVAFGAPIGGCLFCYELSRPNTFWKFQMIWKVFFACSFGVFTLAVADGIHSGDYRDWSGA
jgi:chloride channel 7